MLWTLARRAKGASERDGARPCDRGDGGGEVGGAPTIGDRGPEANEQACDKVVVIRGDGTVRSCACYLQVCFRPDSCRIDSTRSAAPSLRTRSPVGREPAGDPQLAFPRGDNGGNPTPQPLAVLLEGAKLLFATVEVTYAVRVSHLDLPQIPNPRQTGFGGVHRPLPVPKLSPLLRGPSFSRPPPKTSAKNRLPVGKSKFGEAGWCPSSRGDFWRAGGFVSFRRDPNSFRVVTRGFAVSSYVQKVAESVPGSRRYGGGRMRSGGVLWGL